MSDKKILIVTYYWPPSGGSGVQRWLKFVKYLPQFGWTPYVFTPENPSFDLRDESLEKDIPHEAEIIKLPIWEPYHLFKAMKRWLTGKGEIGGAASITNKSLFQRMSTWIRGNFFIPDPRVFWVRPSVKFLDGFLRTNQIQTIVTTGPPHSMHLIGLGLKKKNPSLKWIADFRDPWSEWFFLDLFSMTPWVRSRHKYLEHKVLVNADEVITITPYYQKRLELLSGRKVTLITNGFDEDDFKGLQHKKPLKFTIRHIGIVYEMSNPLPLIQALANLIYKLPDFRANALLEFVGEVNIKFQHSVERSEIAGMVQFIKPVPHREVLNIYADTSVLVLNIEGYKQAEGLLPGKIFEYLATGLPILGIGPVEGDSSDILKSTQSGEMFGKEDIEGMAQFLKRNFIVWKNSEPEARHQPAMQYARRELTDRFLKVVEER